MAAAQPLSDSQKMFHVYVHRRATDGSVFYVGKGQKRRPYYKRDRNPHWHRTFDKHGLVVEIVLSTHDEREAFQRERELIAHYGRENLCNLTDGGEGASGVTLSPEHKAALMAACRRAHLGSKHSPEWIAKVSASKRAKAATSPTKVAKPNAAKRHSEEYHQRMRNAWTPARRAAQAARAADRSRRPIFCVETGERFESIKAAGEWLAATTQYKTYFKISTCCRGKCAKAYGFSWIYAD